MLVLKSLTEGGLRLVERQVSLGDFVAEPRLLGLEEPIRVVLRALPGALQVVLLLLPGALIRVLARRELVLPLLLLVGVFVGLQKPHVVTERGDPRLSVLPQVATRIVPVIKLVVRLDRLVQRLPRFGQRPGRWRASPGRSRVVLVGRDRVCKRLLFGRQV